MGEDSAIVALVNRIESDLRSLVYSEVAAVRESLVPVDFTDHLAMMEARIEDVASWVAEARAAAVTAQESADVATDAAIDAIDAANDAASDAADAAVDDADAQIDDAVEEKLPAALEAADDEPRRRRGFGWNDKI